MYYEPVTQARQMTPTGDGLMPSYLTLSTLMQSYNGVANRDIAIEGDYSMTNHLEMNPLEALDRLESDNLGRYELGIPGRYASLFGEVTNVKYSHEKSPSEIHTRSCCGGH